MTWTPLVGHEQVLAQLRRAMARGRLGHSFLFAGPEGVGKRRTARELARALLCERNPPEQLRPCGECAACRQVEAGTHPDYTEVGKPADRHEMPIELIQDLCAHLSLKPARGRSKVCVLDDADLLNEESANCFLKTLEEPPPGSLLLLIVTSVETQLTTIASRCQVLQFQELPPERLAPLLLELKIADSARQAEELASIAGGSVGWAAEMAKEEWGAARKMLIGGLERLPDGATAFCQEVHTFVESAGKEAALRRGRARQIVRLAADFFRRRLSGVGGQSSWGDDVLLDLIDRCLQADYHIARFLNQSLAMDCWIDDLAQLAAGGDVRPVGRGVRM
jgi:DNA polymerase-3 subunit delta'